MAERLNDNVSDLFSVYCASVENTAVQHGAPHEHTGGLRFKKKNDENGAFRAMRNSPQGLLLHNLLLWHHLKQLSDFVTSFIG